MHDQNESNRDPLQNQLSNLDQLFQEFADQYDTAAKSLRDGYVPDPIPNIQLDAARKVFDDTLTAIREAASTFELDEMEENPSIGMATAYFNRVLEARAEAERQRQLLEDATAIVREVEGLKHLSAPEELHRVSEAIEMLMTRLQEKNLEDAESLTVGSHPLAMLAAYAGHRETLSDEEYDAFRSTIEEQFGRPVLRDIDRGRIVLEAEDSPSESEESDHTDDIEAETPISFDLDETILAPIEHDDTLISEEMPLETEAHLDTENTEPEVIDHSDDVFMENVIEEEIPEEEAVTETALFAELDEGDDTLWPPLEGDGFGAVADDAPEASLHENNDEDEENE